jgi:hypothetical protein
MWKSLLIALLPNLIELAFDYFIIAARKLAKQTDTTIDDEMVDKLEAYRDRLVGTAKTEIKKH